MATALLAHGAAFAENNNVTLYGKLNVDLERLSAPGGSSANPSVNRVTSNSSLFGLRGSEDLGGGLSAFFQLESSVGLDTGSGTLAGRNSAVGLKGALGTVLLGMWDTPYKNATTPLDPFGDKTFAGYGAILYGNSSATAANAASRNSFDRRQRNVVQYWSPAWSGVTAKAAYAVAEEKNTCAVACTPSLWSLSANYDGGPLTLIAAVERHAEYANTAASNSRDTGMKLAASYTFGATTVSAVAERLSFEGNLAATGLAKTFSAGAAREATLRNYWIGATHTVGAQTLRLAYGQSGDVKLNTGAAPDTGARYLALGYGYALSKRTELYLIAAKIDNQAKSKLDFAINGLGGMSNGANPAGFGLGLTHGF